MRKRIIAPPEQEIASAADDWLDLANLAEVEVTSEDAAHPIEAALLPEHDVGWRAAAPGQQTIRLIFMRPQPLERISLTYNEPVTQRTQEYVLRWSPDGGQSFREIARQQWNFSPQGAVTETEDHRVDLPAVTVLELCIVPDIGGGNARASLTRLRLATR
jgi:hypothetical protein